MKIKVSGQKQWERRLNFDVDDIAFINGIAQTTDGGFVLASQLGMACFDCSIQPPKGATLVKLRPNGAVAWKNITASGLGYFFSQVIPIPDGGVIAIGGRSADSFESGSINRSLIVRVTATGDVVWKKSFTTLPEARFSLGGNHFISSTATPHNGLIIAFPTRGPGGRSAVISINNLGNVLWKKSFVGFDFQSVGVTTAGQVILVGTGNNKLKVVVLKANGTLSWNAGYSINLPGSISSVSSPIQTLDGGYVITGSTIGSGTVTNGFIAKIDSSRKIVFQNSFGNGQAFGKSIFVTSDGGFFLFGKSRLGLLVTKMNSEGIVPGCDFLRFHGTTTNEPFGPLETKGLIITTSDLSIEPLDFGLSSGVTKHSVSTVCQ